VRSHQELHEQHRNEDRHWPGFESPLKNSATMARHPSVADAGDGYRVFETLPEAIIERLHQRPMAHLAP
jgi:hypothetical protein